MRKVLQVITLLLLIAQYTVQAQTPVIKVPQYTIIIERTITHLSTAKCYKYVTTGEAVNPVHCFTSLGAVTNPGQFPTQQLDFRGWCYVEDDACGCGSTTGAGDKLAFNLYRNGVVQPAALPDINLNTLPKGSTYSYYDTIRLLQPQFDITQIESEIRYNEGYPYYWYYTSPEFNMGCQLMTTKSSLFPAGEFYDKTFGISTPRYNLSARVKILPNLDPSYTLPSHDKIQITQSTSLAYTPVWQYQDTVSSNWYDISPSFTSSGGNKIEISGFDIFGAGYVNYLHSTVKFRVRNPSNTIFSDPVAFTLRLSSPHITGVIPTHLNCFEKNEGALKIQFDRALLPGEKLNILLLDTVNRVNYSALNLGELAGDNSYTWPNELRAGIYHINLLGKYAKGLESDIYVDTRIDTITQYIALNSVNFEDGFNTPQDVLFDAFTDYTGYSQATYTGSLTHLAFMTLTQPQKIRFIARVDSMVRCKGTPTGVITLAAGGGKYNYKYSLKHQDSASWSAWTNFDNNTIGTVYIPNPFFFADQGVTAKVRNLYAGNYLVRVRDVVDCYPKDSSGNEITYAFTITEPEKGITIEMLEVTPITAADSANGQIRVHVGGGTPFVPGEIFHWPYDISWTDSATNTPVSYTNDFAGPNLLMESTTGKLADGVYYLRLYDAYYSSADPNIPGGCYLELKIPVRKPLPLLVNIERLKQITCYDSANAELIAKVTGGVPIDSLRYTFKWYRVITGGNILLPGTDSVLTQLGPGTYEVEVTDKYDNKKTSQTFELTQPSPLQLQLSATEATCYSSANGSMSVLVTGGTPYSNGSYIYEWSTGHRTPTVNNVAGGNYLVIVTDSMYCLAKDTISVTSPIRIIPTVVTQPVGCKGACDGQIAASATGGSGTYTWLWNTGAATATISNLCPGTYWFTVTDASGCTESDTIILDEPDTLYMSLGADRKMCIGQTIRLDATASDTAILTYQWNGDNGFTANTAKVGITQPGTYRVAVSNIRGCILRDTIVVTAIDSVINTDFVVSTQAFAKENVSLVNISQPRTDSVHWIIPYSNSIVSVVQQSNDKCELVFADTGRFAITMRAFYSSGCIEDSTKIINVIARSGPVTSGNQGNAYLKAYAVIYPNPNMGTFKVDLKFSETTKARLRLVNTLTNITVDDRLVQGSDEYLLDYNMGLLANGVYVLVIDAAKGSFVYKVIIAQ